MTKALNPRNPPDLREEVMMGGCSILNREQRFFMENSRKRLFRAIAQAINLFALIAYPSMGVAQKLEMSFENDWFYPGAGDDDYSNGLRISVECSDRWIFTIGQNFYTPQDISRSDFQEGERPYASWLYLGLTKRLEDADSRQERTFELQTGMTGKLALGKEVQTGWHALVGATKPRGWAHQVKPVPGWVGLIGIWEHKVKYTFQTADSIKYAQFAPYYRLTFGNVHVNGAFGASIRLGYNLPSRHADRHKPVNFSVARLRQCESPVPRDPPDWSFHVLISGVARLVGWNALIQHDTYSDNEHRTIKCGMGVAEAGVGIGYKRIHLGYRLVWRSPEFDKGRQSRYGGVHYSLDLKGSN